MIGCIIQARMGSSRLPGKVMLNIDKKNPVIYYVIEQLKHCKNLEDIVVATTRLKKDDVQSGYLLDGFPRTIPQADGLNKIMDDLSHSLNCALSLTADADELVQRLINRGKDSGRSDDAPKIIRQRQKIYWKQTAPLLDFYREKNLLKEIDGIGEIPEITDRILGILK